MLSGEGSVEGIINFGGGTTATSASTMNSFDKITGSSSATDSLDVTLINASGAPIGAGAEGEAQVNKLSIQSVTADVAQVNQYVFAQQPTASATLTFTYGGNNGSFTSVNGGTGAADSATNFAAALNSVAGQTIATVGSATSSIASGAGVVTLQSANSGLKVGMSVLNSSTFLGYVKSVDSPTQVTLDRSITAITTAATLTYGGGTAGVTVIAPVAGVTTPSLSFSSTATITQSLNVQNVAGNEGDLVTFTYNGLNGTYAIGSSIDATAANLKNALTATIPTNQADAALVQVSGYNNDYVTLTSATKGVPLASLTFSGSAGNTPITTTLTANVAASGAISFGSVSDVEVLNLTNTSGSKATVSQTSIASANQLWSDNSTSDLEWTNVGKTTTLGIAGTNSSTQLGAVTGTYVAGTAAANFVVSGGAKAGNVTLDGNADGLMVSANVTSTKGAQSGTQVNTIGTLYVDQAVKTVNITADTSLTATNRTAVSGTVDNTAAIQNLGVNLLSSDVGALKTINVSGAGTKVTLGTLQNTVETVNGTNLTGGIAATLNTGMKSFLGGAGNDEVTTAALAQTTKASAINANGGTGNILIVGAATDIDTLTEANWYAGFNTLRLSESQNMDVFQNSIITGIQMNAATSAVLSNVTAAQAGNITVRGSQGTAFTVGLKNANGTSDSVKLNLANPVTSSVAAANVDVAGLKIVGVENLTINATTQTAGGTAQSDLGFGSGGADKLSNVVVTGSANVKFAAANTAKAIDLNASASSASTFETSGAFVVGSTIIGSLSGKNTFEVAGIASAGSSYTGGNNDDTFIADAAVLAADDVLDNVLDGAGGVNTLRVVGTLTLDDADFKNISNMSKLNLADTTSVSLTSGKYFNAAYDDGVVITSSTLANGATYTADLALFDENITLTLVSAGDGAANTDNISIVTGAGDDTVFLTAASWVGNTSSNGQIIISAGEGADTISVTLATTLLKNVIAPVIINGGLGSDVISVFAGASPSMDTNVKTTTFVFSAGHSTLDAYDSITGFKVGVGDGTTGTASSTLDFTAVNLTAYQATAAAGYSFAELNVGIASNGVATFGGSLASTASVDMKASALASVVVTNNGDSAVFQQGGNTYVFNNNAAGDSLVELVDITGSVSLGTTNSNTAGLIFIV